MPLSDAQKKATAKYSKDNFQHISFKARIGSRDRIKEAAEATGQSVNSFIRTAISKAVMEATNKPLEPTTDETAKAKLISIVREELNSSPELNPLITSPVLEKKKRKIEKHILDLIENESTILERFSRDYSPSTKGKKLRRIESEERQAISDLIYDLATDTDDV